MSCDSSVTSVPKKSGALPAVSQLANMRAEIVNKHAKLVISTSRILEEQGKQ